MKTQITLLPPKGILAAAEVMTLADTPEKHGDCKWKTMTPATHVDAALRHLYAWLSGEGRDPELGTSHLANAAVRLLMSCERELDEQERIGNTPVPGTVSDMARRADGFRKRWDDRINYTHAEEAPLPVPSDVKYRIVDTHPRGYVHLMESPLPAPVQPEYEAWLDGKLVDGIDSIPPSQWDNMNREFLAEKKTLDDCTGQEWNAASAAYYAGLKGERYDNATRNQSKGDEE